MLENERGHQSIQTALSLPLDGHVTDIEQRVVVASLKGSKCAIKQNENQTKKKKTTQAKIVTYNCQHLEGN